MSMRTREEIQADASRAFAQRDLGAMRRLAAEATDHNDLQLNGLHHHLLANLASVENRTDDAVGEYRRAAESFEGAGDRASAARMLGGIARISYSAGRFEEARELMFEHLRSSARRITTSGVSAVTRTSASLTGISDDSMMPCTMPRWR
ncbi:MAG: hypothetical protein IPH85_14025 [Ignavibacteria bacterium]|nr:hypothetical protein [Ignavibacteria bacterium]